MRSDAVSQREPLKQHHRRALHLSRQHKRRAYRLNLMFVIPQDQSLFLARQRVLLHRFRRCGFSIIVQSRTLQRRRARLLARRAHVLVRVVQPKALLRRRRVVGHRRRRGKALSVVAARRRVRHRRARRLDRRQRACAR